MSQLKEKKILNQEGTVPQLELTNEPQYQTPNQQALAQENNITLNIGVEDQKNIESN